MRIEANTALVGRDRWMAPLADPSIRLLLGFGAFVLAVIMLAGFYAVIQHGVAQAHTHWAKATRLAVGCEPGRGDGGDHCLSAAGSVTMRQVPSAR